jgi:hypothetical protein
MSAREKIHLPPDETSPKGTELPAMIASNGTFFIVPQPSGNVALEMRFDWQGAKQSAFCVVSPETARAIAKDILLAADREPLHAVTEVPHG